MILNVVVVWKWQLIKSNWNQILSTWQSLPMLWHLTLIFNQMQSIKQTIQWKRDMQKLCKEARSSPTPSPFPFRSHSPIWNDQEEWCVHQVKLNYISFWNERQQFMDVFAFCIGSVLCISVYTMYIVHMCHLPVSIASFDIYFFFSFPFSFSIFAIYFNGFNKFSFHAPSPFMGFSPYYQSTEMYGYGNEWRCKMRDPFQEREMWQRKIMSS